MVDNKKRLSVSEVRKMSETLLDIKKEVAKAVVGQSEVVDSLLCAVLCDGHVLVEGVPGIAKTLLINSLGRALGCSSKRIQFTADMLPSDITGIVTYTPKKGFDVLRGPVFSNFIIADEINRSPPKTQSAMLEVMQEKQVTIGLKTYKLDLPFLVMANENPLENSGVYPLPEALVDRFLFKVLIGYPSLEEEDKIMEQNVTLRKLDDMGIKAVASPAQIIKMQKVVHDVYVSDKVKQFILKIVSKTRKKDFEYGKFIDYGASPRATIGLFIAGKAKALMSGRNFVTPQDIRDVAFNTLRHRIMVSYKAKFEGITADIIIADILKRIPVD